MFKFDKMIKSDSTNIYDATKKKLIQINAVIIDFSKTLKILIHVHGWLNMSTYSLKRCLIKMHTDVYTQMLHFFKLFLEAFSSEVWPEGPSGTVSWSKQADLTVLVIN